MISLLLYNNKQTPLSTFFTDEYQAYTRQCRVVIEPCIYLEAKRLQIRCMKVFVAMVILTQVKLSLIYQLCFNLI